MGEHKKFFCHGGGGGGGVTRRTRASDTIWRFRSELIKVLIMD